MLQAARRDVAEDDETKRYVRGARVLDREVNTPPTVPTDDIFTQSERQVLLRRMYNPDKQVDALQATLQGEVDRCLRQAGYVRFALTRDQARMLKRYRPAPSSGELISTRWAATPGSSRRRKSPTDPCGVRAWLGGRRS